MSPAVIAAVLAIVFFAALVRGAFGFGDALVGMPLLAGRFYRWIYGLLLAAGIVLLLKTLLLAPPA